MAYGVIRTDRMYGTDVAPNLVSVKYMGTGTTATAIENGNVVKLNGLMTGEREVYKGVTPAANTPLDQIAIIASPEVMYDERKHNLDQFINEADRISRAYIPHVHGIFSVTKEDLDTTAIQDSDDDEEVLPVVGNIVELMAGTKLKVTASLTSGSTKVGEIIQVETTKRYTYYVIEVK